MTTGKKSKKAGSPLRAAAKKAPMSVLAQALHELPASGEAGFEGLIAKLLTKLTGTPYLVRRSGSQQGRDLDSSSNAAESIFVECKRYEESSALDERGLRTQIDITANAAPGFDMWVLATTRSVDGSAAEWLAAKTRELGADFYVLPCGSELAFSDLDFLAATFSDNVVAHCKANGANASSLRSYLRKVKASPGFGGGLARIQAAFSSATAGLPTFRNRLNQTLNATLRDEAASRLRLNAPLAAGESTPINVPRRGVQQKLESFASTARTPRDARICVVQGEEGNGKSWAVASWVRGVLAAAVARPVFWFRSSASKELGVRDLARLAVTQLQTADEEVFRRKLQRWFGSKSEAAAIVVLDGINERHTFEFWTEYIASLIAETGPNVLVVITCRPDTWRKQLQPRLHLPGMEVDLSEFDEEEFTLAMEKQPREFVDKLWSLGMVARKPRYLADALAYLRRGGDVSEITVEMLQYHAWRSRYRTRMDYPVGPAEFEDVLKHLAGEMGRRVTGGELNELLPFHPNAREALAELASGGVLRRDGPSVSLERPYLVEGLSLLLIDALRSAAASSVAELRQQVGVFVHDTQRNPLTAEVCASAAYKALADHTLRDEIAVALTLEFLDCQNAEQNSVEGVIALASKRPLVISQVAEALWASPGVDSTIEQMVLHGLVQLAKNAQPGSATVNVLARWAGFVHEHGELYSSDAGELAVRTSASVNSVAPSVGLTQLSQDGDVVVTRIANQRLLRLSRLALAVCSLADRQTFFSVPFNSLVADSVMLTSRGNISGWVLGSSRSALKQHMRTALERVDALTGLPHDGKRRIKRLLLEAAAEPSLASELRRVRQESEVAMRGDPLRNFFRSPAREELPAFLANPSVQLRGKIEAGSRYASDAAFDFPAAFASQLRAYARSFSSTSRRLVLGTTIEDHNWEQLEPLLCRLCPDEYERLVRDFVQGVELRADEAIYPWLWAADGYVSMFELPEVTAVRRTWERFLAAGVGHDNDRAIEFTTFGMLLAYMTPQEQVLQLIRRGNARAHLVSFENEFQELASPAEQEAIAALAANEHQLLPVLWYAIGQEKAASEVWLPLIDRALAHIDSVARGFALELLFRMPPPDVGRRLDAVTLTAEPTYLEKHWFTRLHLHYSELQPADILQRSDLTTCAEVLGFAPDRSQKPLAVAFAGHVVLWLNRQIDPLQPPSPELRVTVQAPAPTRGGLASVSVDWSQVDNTVSYRSELSTWGGLEEGDGFGSLKDSFSDSRFSELQNALTEAMKSAEERGNWAYTAFWSDGTLTALLEAVPGFRAEIEVLIEHAKTRRRLRSIGSFISALARVGLRAGDSMGLELLGLIRAQDVVVRSVDGWTESDLLDVALASYPHAKDASNLWLERIDASGSDAYVLANCELLVQGGNRDWLVGQAQTDLGSEAPYFRRRGLLLLAGSGCELSVLDSAVNGLGTAVTGLEDVVRVARDYCGKLQHMQVWVDATFRSHSPTAAKCAATLALHCADARIWNVLRDAAKTHGQPKCGASVAQLLPRDDIKKAVKATLKERDKSLYGYRKSENDAAPWLQSEAKASVRLAM